MILRLLHQVHVRAFVASLGRIGVFHTIAVAGGLTMELGQELWLALRHLGQT